ENRGRHCTLRQLQDLEACLPFALLGLDADNGGEFINHHVVAWTCQRPRPILLTRSRPYHKMVMPKPRWCACWPHPS
ncbi:MAG: hypothetical protein N2689_01805, partial [Verrucomicrobiae bacterium]|nr:hypothetical protein [Verrucomicrobiae bacterium]